MLDVTITQYIERHLFVFCNFRKS